MKDYQVKMAKDLLKDIAQYGPGYVLTTAQEILLDEYMEHQSESLLSAQDEEE